MATSYYGTANPCQGPFASASRLKTSSTPTASSKRNTGVTPSSCRCPPGVLQTAEGTKKLRFLNLKDLISRFEKPNQGLVVPLLKPIQRSTPCLRWRRSKVERDSIYENSNSDYVEVLP
ncbi:SH2 domain-containing protein 1B isoform 3-T3 [Hipposideros larvatus]